MKLLCSRNREAQPEEKLREGSRERKASPPKRRRPLQSSYQTTMPQCHDPSPIKAGPGSALTTNILKGKRTRRRLKKKSRRKVVIAGDDDGQKDDGFLTGNNNNNVDNISLSWRDDEDEISSLEVESVTSKQQQQQQEKKQQAKILFEDDASDASEGKEPVQSQSHASRTNGTSNAMATTEEAPPTKNCTSQNNKKVAQKKKNKRVLPTSASASSKRKSKQAMPPALTPKRVPSKARPTVTIQRTAQKRASSHPHLPVAAALSPRSTTTSSSRSPPSESRRCEDATIAPNRCAIAFDTRFLETQECQEAASQLMDEYHNFLGSLAARGITPTILVCSIPKVKTAQGNRIPSSRRRNAVAVQSWSPEEEEGLQDADDDDEPKKDIVPTWICPPINNGNKVNRKAVQVPKPLLANDSWKHFGEMIESIIESDTTRLSTRGSCGKKQKRLPLDVTIVTNDLSLFCDINEASHKRAISRFWDLVKPFFQDKTLGTIHIAVAKTGILALAREASPSTEEHPSNDQSSPLSDASKKENCCAMVEDDTEEKDTTAADEEARARSMHEVSIANCIRALQAQIATRVEADFKAISCIGNAEPIPLVDISLSIIDALHHPRLGFQSLLRRCFRDTVESAMALYSSSIATTSNITSTSTSQKQNVQLNLPDTMDGTQCSVFLDVTYKILPFALDRPVATKGFFLDLIFLSGSQLDIVQLVPLACIDAALLFGVPMSVRAALQEDIQQYQEMLVLVRSLFKYLQEKQVAMLLCIKEEPPYLTSSDDSDGNHKNDKHAEKQVGGIFHNAEKRGQTFLLMAEEVPLNGNNVSPLTGVLFRYASADELLLEAEKPFCSKMDASSVPEDVAKQYEAYVENALDVLDCDTINPLYLDAITCDKNKATREASSSAACSPFQPTTDNKWNDATGVGALGVLPMEIDGGGGGGAGGNQSDGNDSSEDDNDDFFQFDYS
jgi:hypothetical protein